MHQGLTHVLRQKTCSLTRMETLGLIPGQMSQGFPVLPEALEAGVEMAPQQCFHSQVQGLQLLAPVPTHLE